MSLLPPPRLALKIRFSAIGKQDTAGGELIGVWFRQRRARPNRQPKCLDAAARIPAWEDVARGFLTKEHRQLRRRKTRTDRRPTWIPPGGAGARSAPLPEGFGNCGRPKASTAAARRKVAGNADREG